MKVDRFFLNILIVCPLTIFIILSISQAGYADNQKKRVGDGFEKAIDSVNIIRPLSEKNSLNPHCKVKYTCNSEANVAFEAINRAFNFFKNNGYEINTQINIKFLRRVTTNIFKSETCNLKDKQILALYDGGTNCIKITSLMTDYCRNIKIWGIFPLDKEFYTSIVTHEVAHKLFDSILDSRGETTDHSFSEFIAYVTQIATMKEPHKSKVLSLWPEEKLPSVFAINSFVWMADPNKFCIMSYRLFKSQPEVLRQILDGEIKPVESSFILDY